MKYKIITGFLLLALLISSGLVVYYYSALASRIRTINNMQGYLIVAWARQMSVASYYLENVTTNFDMALVTSLFDAVSDTGTSAWVAGREVYTRMSLAPSFISQYLGAYAEGTPSSLKYINSNALTLIRQLAQQIRNATILIIGSQGPSFELKNLAGEDPVQLLEEKGILDKIINGCDAIRDMSAEIFEFKPKFQ